MYGWMAIAVFLIFGHELEKTDPVFWFMMQDSHDRKLHNELLCQLVATPGKD
jgi:hypothetical protein